MRRTTRCWITGTELPLAEARVLDVERAAALRRALAQRLSLVDQLLADLGPRAGNTERAQTLGVPIHAARAVGALVAEAYGTMVQDPELFASPAAVEERRRARWIAEVQAAPACAGFATTLTPAAWDRLYDVARRLRQDRPKAEVGTLMRLKLDALLARLYPGADPAGAAAWLAGQEASALLAEVGLTGAAHEAAREILQRRCGGAGAAAPGAAVRRPAAAPGAA